MRKLRRIMLAAVICLAWAGVSPRGGFPDLPTAEKLTLWKLQSKTNVVYLMGSIHFLKAKNYPLDPVMEEAFNNSRKLVLEVNLETAEKPETQQAMLMKGIYADGKTLKETVSAETYALTEKELKTLGLESLPLARLKPWFVALTITTAKLQRLGYDPNQGLDHYFYRKAKQENRAVIGLETLEYQMERFDGMSERVQEAMLVQTLKESTSLDGELDKIVKAWASGDVGTLDRSLLAEMREYPELYQRLVLDRNRAWIPKIESYLAQNENYLVVVGAGHLVGKDSVIEMLRAKGYSVEQL